MHDGYLDWRENHCETIRLFDVIFWDTGFVMQGWKSMILMRGPDGALLVEHWKDEPKGLYGKL
jgi:hypothetical protein